MDKITQRFVDVWKADFLAKFISGEHMDTRTTVVFWITFNAIISFVLASSFAFQLFGLKGDILESIDAYVPDGASVTKSLGQLSTENIEEPFFREVNAENTTDTAQSESFVMIVDTRSQGYDITSLDAYTGGILVLSDRLYVKDGHEINTVNFSDVPDFSVTKEQVVGFVERYFLVPVGVLLSVFIFIFLMIFYAGVRLIAALWWALMLFVIAKIMGVSISYGLAYKSVLNFYVVPTIVMLVIGFMQVHIPLLVTAIFLVMFIMNLMWYKKHKREETVIDKTAEAMEAKIDMDHIKDPTPQKDQQNL